MFQNNKLNNYLKYVLMSCVNRSYKTDAEEKSTYDTCKSNPEISNSQRDVKEMETKVESLSAKKGSGDCSGSGCPETPSSKRSSTIPSRTR